jgi:hypothetical protein
VPSGIQIGESLHRFKDIFSFSIVFSCFVLFIGNAMAEMPRIIGITNGSVYSNSVRVLFYPKNSTAEYSLNGSGYTDIPWSNVLSASGSYILNITSDGETKTVHFKIDTTSYETLYITEPYGDIPGNKKTRIEIRYERQYSSGRDPLMAVWLEALDGTFLKTLYVSQMPASNFARYTNSEIIREKAIPFWAFKACSTVYNSGPYHIADPYGSDPSEVDAVSGATTVNSSNAKFKIVTFVDASGLPEKVNIVYEANRSASPDTNSLVYRAELNLSTGTSNTPIIVGSYNSIDPVGFSDATEADFLNEDFVQNPEQFNDQKLQITKSVSVNVIPPKISLNAIYPILIMD